MHKPKASDFALDITADLQKWRAFVAIGELGSLTRAALFLDSSQSFLSRQVNGLERECGARLFNRTGRGVELSEAGQRLFPQVKELLERAQSLEHEIRADLHEPVGTVTVATLPSIGTILIGKLYAEVRAKHPGVNLKILEGSSGQVEEWLTDARTDLAILYRYGPTLPEQEESLATVDSYLIGAKGNRLTAQPTVAFASLDGLPFILPAAPNGLRTALDAGARRHRIVITPAIEADSLPLQKQLSADEGLYTVLPIHAVWNEVQEGKLQAARIVEPSFSRVVSLAYSKSKGPTRAVTAVAARLIDIVGQIGNQGLWLAN
ncbi:LysR family transcriptional regulator [Ottowia thiooxydans]|uniref:LysR family transcriptional regulator n=1 Tax=Ottowia thiooxydans TaxID=219182 RepID=UPI000404E7BD|nr:LysR family transcriptional regulator [Ottowia thiooxydans]